MKQLLLMRHAKSSWTDPNVADIDRPLTPRGRKAATRVAKYLEDSSLEPAIVLCTSAVRARQTLELLRPAIPESSTVKIEPRLYSADSKELMTRVRRLSQTAPSVLIIGHNPAIQDLVLTLASEDPRSDEIRKKFPTAALALFDAPIKEWKLFRPGKASLVHFVTPKGLRG
jgi:phosphohistidine phosphatase